MKDLTRWPSTFASAGEVLRKLGTTAQQRNFDAMLGAADLRHVALVRGSTGVRLRAG